MNLKILALGCAGIFFASTSAQSLPPDQAYEASVGALKGSSTGASYISLGGYYNAADGGGGMLVLGPACGSGNDGSTFVDAVPNCYYRLNPTNDVREWGAYCDVVSVSNTASTVTTWNPSISTGALVVPNALLPPSHSTFQPAHGEFITATQIGPVTPSGLAGPPVWADRWSTITGSGTGMTGYKAGDLLTFTGASGGSAGNFSQQIAISVDQVADSSGYVKPAGSSGEIYKWHFVWGGQYTSLPTAPMVVDPSYSITAGSNANFNPAWSGWSVMDHGTTIDNILHVQTGYTVGATVTFGLAGGTVNGTQNPEIIVMAVSGPPLNAVTAWQWLNYGSYSAIPGTATDLIQSSATCSPTCTGLAFVPEWTRGALATTIASIIPGGTGTCPSGDTCIVPTDIPSGIPSGTPIENFYYGHDDSTAIQTGVNNTVGAGTTPYSYTPGAVRITGYCGTTQPILLPTSSSTTTPSSPALVGDAYKTAGLFAFACDVLQTACSNPLLNHVVTTQGQSFGGGLRDLEIEGGGVTQGYGYCGLYTASPGNPGDCTKGTPVTTPPNGYDGPTSTVPACPVPQCQQSTGSVVEIDKANEAYFTNLAIYDAYGEGNAEFQAGFNDSDPTSYINADVGTSFVDSVRTDVTNNQVGALNPEYAFKLAGMHDSQLTRLDAFDGTEADISNTQGNIFSGIHTVSSVLNGTAHSSGTITLGTVAWGSLGPLAGVALYGLESENNVMLTNMQCDTVWIGCVFLGQGEISGNNTPSVVTNVAQKCAAGYANVWPSYVGVLLAAGTSGASVRNVNASPGSCGITTSQLVSYQTSIHAPMPDPSIEAAFQNSATQVSSPALSYVSGRYYTVPFFQTATANITKDTLYALPIQLPSVATMKTLSTNVVNAAGGCHYGLYGNNGAGQPGYLIYDAGNIAMTSGATTITLAQMQTVGPGLVFLVIDCNNNSLQLTAGASTGTMAGTLLGSVVGLTSLTNPSAFEYASSTYGALPTQFPSGLYSVAPVPLVYFTTP